MLTDAETKVLNWIYSMSNSRLTVIPIRWINGRAFAIRITKSWLIDIRIVCTILLFRNIICINTVMSSLAEKGHNISLAILQSIISMRYAAQLLLQINHWTFRTEFVTLLNQGLVINAIWGR